MALETHRQFAESLKRSSQALVTFRKEWTVDAAATALALARAIEARGKRADIVCDGFQAPKQFRFLPGIDRVQPAFRQLQKFVITLDVSKTKIDELSYDLEGDKLRISVTPKAGQFEGKDVGTAASDFKYDLIIAVDTPDYGSLGSLFSSNTDFFYRIPTVNIDHDPSNEQYGNVNVVDITATSAAEVAYDLLSASGDRFLDEQTATCLLAGMISKTKSFKTATVTPKTLDIASRLVAAGARREEIVQNLFRTRSIATLKLWGRALARLKFDPVTRTAWSLLVRQDFVHAGAEERYLPDVVDELIMNSPDAEVVALIYEQGSAPGICALVSTEKHASASGLVAGLKPEGDRKTARICFPNASLLDAERSVLEAIGRSLGKTPKLPAAPAAPPVNAEPLA
jgi:nanoRNase/pAp phosphatase (c-di-AMP/oligoRNAs hydrolase)